MYLPGRTSRHSVSPICVSFCVSVLLSVVHIFLSLSPPVPLHLSASIRASIPPLPARVTKIAARNGAAQKGVTLKTSLSGMPG